MPVKSGRKRPDPIRRKIWGVQDEERKRIAYELHDGLAQRLGVIGFSLDKLGRELSALDPVHIQLKQIRSLLDSVQDEVRSLSHRLHPTAIDHIGLKDALAALCDEYTSRVGLPVCFVLVDEAPDNISGSVAHALYRIAQEALQNAVRHAQAAQIVVALSFNPNQIRLSIQDDGNGFDLKQQRSGLGLTSIRDRALSVGGRTKFSSSSDGTTVEVAVDRNTALTSAQPDGNQLVSSPTQTPLLRGMLEAATDLIVALDLSFRVIGFNQAYAERSLQLLQCPIEIGTDLIRALSHVPEHQRRAKTLWTRVLEGESFTEIVAMPNSEGHLRSWEVSFSPMKDERGRIISAVHIAREITDRPPPA